MQGESKMIFELDEVPRNRAVMRVIGVGGAGGNAVNRMIDEELEGVDFISANTDAQALATSRAPHTIQIGKRLTQGLGAGARPGVGRQAIAENCEDVRRVLEGSDLVFIAAGMGGGTGTGAAPVIGEMARELGALVIAVVTRPFHFEARKRLRQAEQGIEELSGKVDTVIEVPNDQLLEVVGSDTSFREALKHADEVLLQATKGISDLIRVNGEVNVDFADVRTIMASCGAALLGTGTGRGEDRARLAAREAIESPLLDNISIHGAQGVLLNITGGDDLTIGEVTGISCMIQEAAGDDAEIIFGTVHDPVLEGEVRVTLIATGFRVGREEDARVEESFSSRVSSLSARLRAERAETVDGEAVEEPIAVRHQAVGGSRSPNVLGPHPAPTHGLSPRLGPRSGHPSADASTASETSRPAPDSRQSKLSGRGVARPNIGGGHRSPINASGPSEMELPTFIRRG